MGGKKIIMGVFLLIAVLVIGAIVYSLITGDGGIVATVYNNGIVKPVNGMFEKLGVGKILPEWNTTEQGHKVDNILNVN